MKLPVKKYLSITKKEWNGMVILVIITGLILAIPYVYQWYHKDSTINLKDFYKAAALLNSAKDVDGAGYTNDHLSDQKIAHPVMFVFNPNNLPDTQWKQLGLSEYQIKIIKHYEAKGGHFYKKEDVQKIYAITPGDYKRLAAYINIPSTNFTSNKAGPGTIIEINSADSAKLTTIKGVGATFAARILAYRNRLGGFLNKEQLKEVYGIDTTKYAEIKNQVSINPARIVKIKINAISFEELRRFPYLSNKQTNAVIAYRTQHGSYQSIADMKNIAILNDNILRKIEPYLVF